MADLPETIHATDVAIRRALAQAAEPETVLPWFGRLATQLASEGITGGWSDASDRADDVQYFHRQLWKACAIQTSERYAKIREALRNAMRVLEPLFGPVRAEAREKVRR